MITWREFWALLIAGTWDFSQVTILALVKYLAFKYLGGSDLFDGSDLIQPLYFCGGSMLISLILAFLLGPHWPLLPVFILENIPAIKFFPSTVAGVFVIIRRRHRIPKQELSDS